MLLKPHLDANETAYFIRQLVAIAAKTYDKKFPALKGKILVPVNNEVTPGMSLYAFDQYEPIGRAKVVSSAAMDLPRVDVVAREDQTRIRQVADKYGYTTKEVRAAAAQRGDLPMLKANAAREAIEQKLDQIIAIGDAEWGLLGLLTQTSATIYTIPADGTGSSALWSTKTTAQILRDLNGIVTNQVNLTKETFTPDTMVLPVDKYNLLANTPWSANSDTTILQQFLENNPYIKEVIPWYYCSGAGSGGTDRMVVYKKDPDNLAAIIPLEFTSYEPTMKNLSWEVPCEAESGGVVLYRPLSMSYGDGF
jgi:hypothetical protein